MILGYAVINTKLLEDGITPNKTARMKNIDGVAIMRLVESNLDSTLRILEWNEQNGIFFYRMSSGLMPHITNPRLLDDPDDYRQLLYSPGIFAEKLEKIGEYQLRGHRLTFHAEPFVVINSPDSIIRRESLRELHCHALMMNLMKLDADSVIVLHGGGVYDNKEESMKRFVDTFISLPDTIKHRIALENDERRYSLDDIVRIHESIRDRDSYILPIVLDLFHFECYTGRSYAGEHMDTIISSWSGRNIKMHISEQLSGGKIGTHSDFVYSIPRIILDLSREYIIYLMIEAKMKEQAVLLLIEKYNLL